MVSIKASYTVVPNEATPEGIEWLSDIDQVARLCHTQTIYVFHAKHNLDALVQQMRNSLSKILCIYYPLAGRLRRLEEGGRWEVDCNAKGAMLFEAESTKTVNYYGDFLGDSANDLVPKVNYTNTLIQDIPLLLVQVTSFLGNEAFSIGVAVSHILFDGISAIHFINSWAKLARGDTLESHEMPFLDRTVLKFTAPPPPPRFDHQEFKPMPLILGRSDNTVEKNKRVSAISLKLTAEQVGKLKNKANADGSTKGSRPYSRFEAIAAHVWRSASKARGLDENQPTLLRFSGDIRNRLIPPLPRNYIGNALSIVSVSSHVGEILSSPLGHVAQKIREAVEMITHEFICSQIDVIRGQEHVNKARTLYYGANEGKDVLFFGNPNLRITSWLSMPMHEAGFGWGKPVYSGLAGKAAQERAVITQSPDGDGSVILVLHFQVEHMELFKNYFYEEI
ncbi:shikimate O-hydroxycinnamoyltransferase [Vigna unguiculata]|uniref:Shikimate O-hydroxycinnamoyltransferase n=1 Tax=Vigna unguiculata TaxID=3917 RepID=A0A4D6KSB0_VIGUN|nr:shikimate O-hydroxycinnamoyltransferase [Vigna unguiculata]QCD79452.1 shikimate O-hydroxycinnamoyltransferase [Vigna unguiculata]QCD79453.1 shikimate O-hydroxycinnamoyltransferase [Vigna unguiculata]QCD80957.1 shikimate O-hydroxycinnamoyltransferase [Vigna unguiculata]